MLNFISKKLSTVILSAVVLVADKILGLELPKETLISFTGIVMSYILGQSYIDSKK